MKAYLKSLFLILNYSRYNIVTLAVILLAFVTTLLTASGAIAYTYDAHGLPYGFITDPQFLFTHFSSEMNLPEIIFISSKGCSFFFPLIIVILFELFERNIHSGRHLSHLKLKPAVVFESIFVIEYLYIELSCFALYTLYAGWLYIVQDALLPLFQIMMFLVLTSVANLFILSALHLITALINSAAIACVLGIISIYGSMIFNLANSPYANFPPTDLYMSPYLSFGSSFINSVLLSIVCMVTIFVRYKLQRSKD